MDFQAAVALRDPSPAAMVFCAGLLSKMDSDPFDVAEIFDKFREWLRRDVGLTQRLLGNARLQPIIVQALKRHGANLEVARHGIGAAAGCFQRSDQNAELMMRAGIIDEIRGLMDAHAADTIVQDMSCIALWRLAERNGSGAERIVQAGGVERVLRAMREHRHNPFVQCNACMAMERLYLKGGAPADGWKEAAEEAMAMHPSNTQIRRGATRLIEALAKSPAIPPRPRAPAREPPQKPAHVSVSDAEAARQKNLGLPFHEWLMQLDDVGFLMEYHGELRQNFDSLAQVVDVYAPAGELDPQFFDDLGVTKLGHRRLFEKWCRDTLPHQTLATR